MVRCSVSLVSGSFLRYTTADSPNGIQLLEKELGVSPKEVLQAEFDIFVKLSFSLFVESDEVMPHYSRLLTLIEQKQADDQ